MPAVKASGKGPGDVRSVPLNSQQFCSAAILCCGRQDRTSAPSLKASLGLGWLSEVIPRRCVDTLSYSRPA